MKTVRTTISLPQQVYEEIRSQAFEERKSFGQVIADKFGFEEPQQKFDPQETWDFFQKVGKEMGPFDAAQLIREDRDHGHD